MILALTTLYRFIPKGEPEVTSSWLPLILRFEMVMSVSVLFPKDLFRIMSVPLGLACLSSVAYPTPSSHARDCMFMVVVMLYVPSLISTLPPFVPRASMACWMTALASVPLNSMAPVVPFCALIVEPLM